MASMYYQWQQIGSDLGGSYSLFFPIRLLPLCSSFIENVKLTLGTVFQPAGLSGLDEISGILFWKYFKLKYLLDDSLKVRALILPNNIITFHFKKTLLEFTV